MQMTVCLDRRDGKMMSVNITMCNFVIQEKRLYFKRKFVDMFAFLGLTKLTFVFVKYLSLLLYIGHGTTNICRSRGYIQREDGILDSLLLYTLTFACWLQSDNQQLFNTRFPED